MTNQNYPLVVRGSQREVEARKIILQMFKSTPVPDEELLTNLGLYIRSTLVAKILYLNELYEQILPLPGVVIEFGVWWGANLALFESLRSVLEPYNWTRQVVGFDTFAGYTSISDADGQSQHVAEGGYTVTPGYEAYLENLLNAHEADNVMSHLKKYDLVKGDVVTTVDAYFEKHPQSIVALAYFDLALYEPTKKCLEAIRPHLARGSVLAMDELNSPDFPGETIALKEVLGLNSYKVVRSKYLPDRSYVIYE